MNEKEMFERKVWLDVYIKTMENEKRSMYDCECRATEAVKAYRIVFPDNGSDTRD